MEKTPLEKTGQLLGIVENTSQRCICGHLLELKGLSTEPNYASARLICPSKAPGYHFILVVEELRHVTDENRMGQDTYCQAPTQG